ncbi:hypothetical protein PGT21_029630 [Puccinia graminis f. sp. tritici]|uniref:Uncharacterized protein n=1 Tax=Puccinia graminis f. sp. tritici TaxID=56615 RepID=A0A5B0PV52_PUCGR|nr:hypothetical protein PGTUg99_017118 [Puccinia graminis f. sp. tritici]KAA1104672.1 hypothetical protein PGT21_029630 [Puccinia graminis f. sp. tritici]
MAANHEPEDEIVVLFEQRSTQKKKKSAMRAPLVRLVSPEISLVSSRGTQEIQQLTDVKPVKQLAITVAIKNLALHLQTVSPSTASRSRTGTWRPDSNAQRLILKLGSVEGLQFQGLQSLPGFLHKSIQPSQLIEVAVTKISRPTGSSRVSSQHSSERDTTVVEAYELKIIYRLQERKAVKIGSNGRTNQRCKIEDRGSRNGSHSKATKIADHEDVILISSDEDEGPQSAARNKKAGCLGNRKDSDEDIKMKADDVKPDSDERSSPTSAQTSYELSCYLNLNGFDTSEETKGLQHVLHNSDRSSVKPTPTDSLSDADDEQTDLDETIKRFKNCTQLVAFLKKDERLIGLRPDLERPQTSSPAPRVEQNNPNDGDATPLISGDEILNGPKADLETRQTKSPPLSAQHSNDTPTALISGLPAFDRDSQNAENIDKDGRSEEDPAPTLEDNGGDRNDSAMEFEMMNLDDSVNRVGEQEGSDERTRDNTTPTDEPDSGINTNTSHAPSQSIVADENGKQDGPDDTHDRNEQVQTDLSQSDLMDVDEFNRGDNPSPDCGATASPNDPKTISSIAGLRDSQSNNPDDSGSDSDDTSMDFMNFLFEESTTPPFEELHRDPTSNRNTSPDHDLFQPFDPVTIPSTAPPQPPITEGNNPSLANITDAGPEQEQTELERALNEVNARYDFFNDSDPFHSHLSTPEDCIMDGPIAGSLDESDTRVTPPVSVQVDTSSTTPNPSPRMNGRRGRPASPPAPGAVQPDRMEVDIPVPADKPADIPARDNFPADSRDTVRTQTQVPAVAGAQADIPVTVGTTNDIAVPGGTPADIPVTVNRPVDPPAPKRRPTSGPATAGMPGDIPVLVGPSTDIPPPTDKSWSKEKSTKATTRSQGTRSRLPNLKKKTHRPVGKNKRRVGADDGSESSSESFISTDDSSESDSQRSSTMLPSQPQLSGLLGKGPKGNGEPLSYHVLSVRNAALEDFMKRYTAQSRKKIGQLGRQAERLKRTSTKKSVVCRNLKNRLQNKDDKILEFNQDYPSELQSLEHKLKVRMVPIMYNQLRSARAELAQQDTEIEIHRKERELQTLIREDLEAECKQLEAKIRRLESNQNSLMELF